MYVPDMNCNVLIKIHDYTRIQLGIKFLTFVLWKTFREKSSGTCQSLLLYCNLEIKNFAVKKLWMFSLD